MPAYQTGEVERLLGIKPHVLRYWEKEFPMLQPRKDVFGHRFYSGRDVRVLLRLKHLLYGRRFTIEGARGQLLRELSGDDQDIRGIVDAARAELVAVFFIARQLRSQAAAALGETPTPEAESGTEEGSK
jgi:DNA-binding transcriptional MerR regulator